MGMVVSPYRSLVVPSVWTTVFTGSSPTASNGWSGWAFRQRIGAAAISDATGSQVRLTIRSASGGAVVGECWFGKAGAGTFDFDGTQVQVTFGGGSTGASVGANTDIVSDPITFAYTGTVDLMAFYYFSGTTNLTFYPGMSGGGNAQKNANDHGTTSASGYASSAFDNAMKLIEAFV